MTGRRLLFAPRRPDLDQMEAVSRVITKEALSQEIPLRVEYELTGLGRTLFEPMAAYCAWTRAHLAELVAARQAHAEAGKIVR